MAMFLGVHDMGGSMEETKFKDGWETYKSICQKMGCSAKHVHYSADKGRGYCLTEASTAQQVQKAHNEVGVPLVEVLEVKDLQ